MVWPANVTDASGHLESLVKVYVPDTGSTAGQVECYRWHPDGYAELYLIDPGPLVRARTVRRQWDTPSGVMVVKAQHCGCGHPLAAWKPPAVAQHL